MVAPKHHHDLRIQTLRGGGGHGGQGGGRRGGEWLRRVCEDSLTGGLMAVMVMSITVPSVGIVVGRTLLTRCSAHAIFFIAGLRLRVREIQHLGAALRAFACGIGSVNLVTPLFGFIIANALPCATRELTDGAVLLSCMPAAVSSSASLTLQAGGNLALSVLLAVACHSLGVVTIPLLLQWLVWQDLSAQLNTSSLILRLSTTTLVPLLAGQTCFFASSRVRRAVEGNKPLLTLATNVLVVLTPWMHLSLSSSSGVFSRVSASDLFRASTVAILLPCAFTAFNYALSSSLSLSRDYLISLTIVASSKTLPVAVAVLAMLPTHVGDTGLLTLPAILCYFSHILLCSLITRRLDELLPPIEDDDKKSRGSVGHGGGSPHATHNHIL